MIDTHCHIDEEAFAADREEVIARQREKGVEAMIVPGVNVASVETVLKICHRHPGYCYPALGLHPEDVKADWQEQLAIVENAIRTHHDELVAIGEIGLDYYWDKTFKEEQKEVLKRQLLLAREMDLPVILHNREATEDKLPGVFHCFNGSRETMGEILSMGFYLGIGGVITFKNCKLGETLSELVTGTSDEEHLMNRLLLETDAPYMAPVPHRGERNESRWMCYVAAKLSAVLNISHEAIVKHTTENAKRLFRLP